MRNSSNTCAKTRNKNKIAARLATLLRLCEHSVENPAAKLRSIAFGFSFAYNCVSDSVSCNVAQPKRTLSTGRKYAILSRILQIFQNPLQFLYILPAILIGLTVHEWAHAYAAFRLGDPTARNLGRMTLNPLAHIDPIGFLMLLLVGFGWAKPVPVTPRNFKNYKRDDIIVSLAGIFTNIIVAFLFSFVYVAGILKWGLGTNEAFHSIVGSVITITLALAIFNLLPIYPLDGSHVAESLLMHKIPRVFMFLRQYGQLILLGLLISGVVSFVLSYLISGISGGFFTVAAWFVNLF